MTKELLCDTLRVTVGWAFLALFLGMVTVWVAVGFSPELNNTLPEPAAALGRRSEFWPILVGVLSGCAAAWALAPTFRLGGEPGGDAATSLSPLAVAIFGPSSLIMMFAAYWPCSGNETPFWSTVRNAIEAFQGQPSNPFGAVAGCPAAFPQSLLAGILFGKVTLVLVLGIGLTYVFRHSIDEFRARFAPHVVVFSGVSDDTVDILRWVGDSKNFSRRLRLLIMDAGPELARAREVGRDLSKSIKVSVIALDVSDVHSVNAFMRRRGRKGIQGLYIMSPDSAANLRAMGAFLDANDRHAATDRRSEIPGRIVVRVDNPWHAEDWRRQQMSSRPEWLFDAVSTVETSARHVVANVTAQSIPIDRVVISGSSPFELAVLSGLAFEHRVDEFLTKTSHAAQREWDKEHSSRTPYHPYLKTTPRIVLVGAEGKRVADHFMNQLQRFGMRSTSEIIEVCENENREQTMARLLAEGHHPALIVENSGANSPPGDSTFLAVRNPHWIIYSWDANGHGMTEKPLLGGLSVVGPTTKPVPGFGLDIWDRLGAIQHRAYLLNFCGGIEEPDDETGKRALWDDLSAFARESNIRSFAAFTRAIGQLDRKRQLGTDLGLQGKESPAPLQDPAEIEELAIREHQSWFNHHREYGYKFGARKGKRHPDMVEWSELDDVAKAKDFENVRATNDLLTSLGFVLTDAS